MVAVIHARLILHVLLTLLLVPHLVHHNVLARKELREHKEHRGNKE